MNRRIKQSRGQAEFLRRWRGLRDSRRKRMENTHPRYRRPGESHREYGNRMEQAGLSRLRRRHSKEEVLL